MDDEPPLLDVSVEATHGTTPRAGLVVHRRAHLPRLSRAGGTIPQTRLEETTLDLVELGQDADTVVGWLTRACQRRLTTPERLERAVEGRGRLRHRSLVLEVLSDVRHGVASPLERRYVRDVERAHGLPHGLGNARHVVAGVNRYSDVHYQRWRTRVELEGLAYHPAERSHRDQRRDNAVTLTGDATLRYGWRAVASAPCGTAIEVGTALALGGWDGHLRRCSASCPAGRQVGR